MSDFNEEFYGGFYLMNVGLMNVGLDNLNNKNNCDVMDVENSNVENSNIEVSNSEGSEVDGSNNSSDNDSSDEDSSDNSSENDSFEDENSDDDYLDFELLKIGEVLIFNKCFDKRLMEGGLTEEELKTTKKLLDTIIYDSNLPNPNLSHNYSLDLVSYLLKNTLTNSNEYALLNGFVERTKQKYKPLKKSCKTPNVKKVSEWCFPESEVSVKFFEDLECISGGETDSDDESNTEISLKTKPTNQSEEKTSKPEKSISKKKDMLEKIEHYFMVGDDCIKILEEIKSIDEKENSVVIDGVNYIVVYPKNEKTSKLWFKHLGELIKYHNKKKSDKPILEYFTKIGKEAKKIKF
jgi:hypothetical protein